MRSFSCHYPAELTGHFHRSLCPSPPSSQADIDDLIDDKEPDTQINDSEALTSALLIKRIHSQMGGAKRELKLVTQFRDTLTYRLLEMQPHLLSKPGDAVEAIAFHRNYLETAALSVSAHSNVIWTAMLTLLSPMGAASISVAPLAECVPSIWLKQELALSFNDLADVTTSRGLGVLLGWQRVVRDSEDDAGGKTKAASRIRRAMQSSRSSRGRAKFVAKFTQQGEAMLNPADKNEKLTWMKDDKLLFVRRPPQEEPTPGDIPPDTPNSDITA